MFNRPDHMAAGEFCPMIKDRCIKERCRLWMGIKGQSPVEVEGKTIMKDVTNYDCALNWTVISQLEVARQQRSVVAACESYRNEVAGFLSAFAQLANNFMNKALELKNGRS